MVLERFYVKGYYILTKHTQNWIRIKTLLDTPIWNSAKSQWARKWVRLGKIKVENLTEEELLDEIKKGKLTYGTLLKAFGDLIVETNKEIHAPSAIRSKFEEIAEKEYKRFKESIPEEKYATTYPEKIEYTEKTKKKHWEEYKKSFGKNGLNVTEVMNSLNSWLKKATNNSALFVRKVGEDYKLLLYYAEGEEGRIEYFCSEENKAKFAKFINEKRIKIKELKAKFGSILGLEKIEQTLTPSTGERHFFPIKGPFYYNFKNKWVVRRLEVSKIKEGILKDVNKVQLLSGKSASGKTVIARNVGLELQKKKWQVYHISGSYIKNQASDILYRLNYLDNISNRALVIIEDIHKQPHESAILVRGLTKEDWNVRFLITTRKPFAEHLERDKKIAIERCEKIVLEYKNFKSIAGSIITNYKNKQIGERREDLDKFAPKDYRMVKEVADEDLWLLAYALDAWTQDKGINMDMIYDKIKEDISNLDNEFKTNHGLYGASEVLLTLAPFSLYELGVSKSFLKSESGVIKTDPDKREKLLDKLVEYDKIIEENGLYLIPHSTHARLYLETALSQKGVESYKNLLWEIMRRYKDDGFSVSIEDFPVEMIKAYLRTRPMNYRDVIYMIRNGHDVEWSGPSKIEGEKPLVSVGKLLKDKEIQKITISLIKDSNNLGDIYSYLLLFDTAYKQEFISEADVANVLNEIGAKYFLTLIEKASKTLDVTEISFIIRTIIWMGNNNFNDRFVKELDPSVITKNLKIEDISLLSLFHILYYISRIDENEVFKFGDIVQNVVKSEKELDTISEVLKGLFQNEFLSLYLPLRLKLLSLLPAEGLLFLIKKEDNFWVIDRFIFYIRDGLMAIFDSEESFQEFTKVMAEKIDSAENIHKIIQLLGRIVAYNSTSPYYAESINTIRKREEMLSKIIEKIDVKSFNSKVDEVDKLLLPLIPYLNCVIGESENIKFILKKLKLSTKYDKEKIKLKINSLSRKEAREKINYFFQVWYDYLSLPDILNDELYQILSTQNNNF